MLHRRPAGYAIVALASLAFGFLLAAQLRAQLLTPSNAVARSQALVRTVTDLERQNGGYRNQIASVRADLRGLEAQQAARSEATRRLQQEVDALRVQGGLTELRGPGVTVEMASGHPGMNPLVQSPWTVSFQDIDDVVQVLFEGGAEGVAINGRRITPASSFSGSGSAVVVDQGPPLTSPFHLVAVGNQGGMRQMLADPSRLGDLRNRQRQYGVQLSWSGQPDLTLPAYDAALPVTYARGS